MEGDYTKRLSLLAKETVALIVTNKFLLKGGRMMSNDHLELSISLWKFAVDFITQFRKCCFSERRSVSTHSHSDGYGLAMYSQQQLKGINFVILMYLQGAEPVLPVGMAVKGVEDTE